METRNKNDWTTELFPDDLACKFTHEIFAPGPNIVRKNIRDVSNIRKQLHIQGAFHGEKYKIEENDAFTLVKMPDYQTKLALRRKEDGEMDANRADIGREALNFIVHDCNLEDKQLWVAFIN